MLCHQRLVGSDYTFPRLKAALYKCVSRLNASHHFHNNLDLGIIDDNVHIMDDLLLYGIAREIP